MTVTQKPWGYEVLFAHTDKYAGKLFMIRKGQKASLHYHRIKHETIYLYSGLLRSTIEDKDHKFKTRKMNPGDSVVVPPNTKHRGEALEDSIVIEVSTPELDDVFRVDDEYGRADFSKGKHGQ